MSDTQLDLLTCRTVLPGVTRIEPALPYQRHSTTSRMAAYKAQRSSASLRAKVLAYIAECGDRGATDREIQRALEMDGNTERPRRIELVQGFKVKELVVAGEVQKREGCTVWVVRP